MDDAGPQSLFAVLTRLHKCKRKPNCTMKKLILTFTAFMMAVFAHGATALSVAERAQALYESAQASLTGKTSLAAKQIATQTWLTAHADEVNALVSVITEVPEGLQGFIAQRKGFLDNGVVAETWTLSLPLLRTYAPAEYMARAGTLEDLQTYASTDTASPRAIVAASKRLGNPALLEAFWQSQLGKGQTFVTYQRWFKGTLASKTPEAAITAIESEMTGVLRQSQSDVRDKWLSELRTMQVLYKSMQ